MNDKKLLERGQWPVVKPFGFGGAAISGEGGGYGFGPISEADSLTLLNEALDSGVSLYDTAPIYGFCESEKRMGKAFKGRREEVFLISKCGVDWHSTKRVNMTNDPKVSIKQLEKSLKDLQTDYIDLYMVHWPDSKVDIRKTVEALAKAQEQDKILSIGLCNTTVEQIQLAREVVSIRAVQSELNLFQRDVGRELFPFLSKNNISFMSWGTLEKGILSSRVDSNRTFDPVDCRSWAPWWKKSDHRFKYETMEKLKPLLEEFKMSSLELAMAHNLDFPEVDCVLSGPKNSAQLHSLLSAVELNKNSDDLSSLLSQAREVADECRRYYSNS